MFEDASPFFQFQPVISEFGVLHFQNGVPEILFDTGLWSQKSASVNLEASANLEKHFRKINYLLF